MDSWGNIKRTRGGRGMPLFTSMDSKSLPAILERVVRGFHHGEGEVSDSCGDIISDWNPISHIPVAAGRSSSDVDEEVPPSLLRRR